MDERYWPNKRDLGREGEVERGAELEWWMRSLASASGFFRCWIGAKQTGRWEAGGAAKWDRNRLRTENAEEGNCGKSTGRVMRRVYQLFRCRLLIKYHQTLNLLTINALIHYLPSVFPLQLSLFSSLSLWVSVCLPFSTIFSSPFCFSLSNTPNAGQINYLMHLSLSAGAQSNLPFSLFTGAFSHKKGPFWHRKKVLFSVPFSPGRKGILLVPLSPISPELIKLPSMCCKRLIC